MAKFMLLLYDDPASFATMSPEQIQKVIEKYMAWGQKLRQAGYLTASNKLTDEPGRVVRSNDGQLRVTDGPYSETKEVLGGYFTIEAENYDQAIAHLEQANMQDPGVLYAVSGYGAESLWKTTDGGYSWSDVLAGTEYETHADYRFVNNVSLDPTDHQHLVVSTHGGCLAPYQPSCIAETKDGGQSWRVLTAPEGWNEGGGLILVKGGHWIWCGSTMMVTTDAGASWTRDALAGGGSCEAEYTIRSFVPAANGKYYLGSRQGVLRSTDGLAWEHVPGTSGTLVMIAQGSTQVFAANQWQPSLRTASLDDDEQWTDLVAPPQIANGSDGGIPFLAYDDAHHILYASMFSGGVARIVVP